MGKRFTLYSAPASGGVAVEAVLVLLGLPYEVIDGETWHDEAARKRVSGVNARRQVPTLIMPDGAVMTESAAILIALADRYPVAGLAPAADDGKRWQFLRWMMFVSSAIYALYWIKGDPARIGARPDERERVIAAVHERIAENWALMDRAVAEGVLTPAPYLLGERLSVLDIYVTVMSQFGPWRPRFYEVAPRLSEVVRRVDAEPRLLELWQRRMPE